MHGGDKTMNLGEENAIEKIGKGSIANMNDYDSKEMRRLVSDCKDDSLWEHCAQYSGEPTWEAHMSYLD
jgi:hypothetical protein